MEKDDWNRQSLTGSPIHSRQSQLSGNGQLLESFNRAGSRGSDRAASAGGSPTRYRQSPYASVGDQLDSYREGSRGSDRATTGAGQDSRVGSRGSSRSRSRSRSAAGGGRPLRIGGIKHTEKIDEKVELITTTLSFLFKDGTRKEYVLKDMPISYFHLQQEIANVTARHEALYICQNENGDMIGAETYAPHSIIVVREIDSRAMSKAKVQKVEYDWEFKSYSGSIL